MIPLRERMADVPQVGRVVWIGIRPDRREPMQAVAEVEARAASGLAGDRYSGPGKRQVTLIQAEHLAALASLLGGDAAAPAIDPARVRRNIVVRGINLLALRDAQILLGEVQLRVTGPCDPCTRMDEALGPGGFNAMRGHGGLTAQILTPGVIRVGDPVRRWSESVQAGERREQ